MHHDKLAGGIADTALWTAAYRAEESGRPDALFHDPYAGMLAGNGGWTYARLARQPEVRWGVVLRTVVLDELILQAVNVDGCDVVVNLAAGLDARPHRLDLPAGLRWIEVDLPEVIAYKAAMLEHVPARCRLRRHALDLTDRAERHRLFAEVGATASRALILTEGLLGYLSQRDVAALAVDLWAQPSFATWLMHVFGPAMVPRVQTAVDRIGVDDSSVRFAPIEGPRFFRRYGWAETQRRDLYDETVRLGRVSMLEYPAGTFQDEQAAGFTNAIIVARLDRSDRPSPAKPAAAPVSSLAEPAAAPVSSLAEPAAAPVPADGRTGYDEGACGAVTRSTES